MLRVFVATSLVAFFMGSASAQQLAFPTAEGFGRYADGGRGGAVHHVTNLNDSGSGSLRACVAASGPRTCVFRVAGTIQLTTSLEIKNPFITIAGQTAPGGGIALKNSPSATNAPIRILASDVVIRHIRIRPGQPTWQVSSNIDAARISGVGSLGMTENITDIIFDHVSISWGTDETFDFSPWADRITLQNSIVGEGLKPHARPVGLRSCGISIIRTLIANSILRMPNNTCGRAAGSSIRGGGGVTGENEFRNNVVFNAAQGYFDYWNGRGPSEANVVGNVFIRGANTLGGKGAPYAVDARDFTSKYADHGLTPAQGFVPAGTSDPQKLCLQDNIAIGLPGNSIRPAPIHGVLDPRDAHIVASTNCVTNPVGNSAAAGGVRGLTGPVMPSGSVEASVKARSGAFPRDSADARLVGQVTARTGTIYTTVAQAGGWPALTSGTPYPDADADGMSDIWEVANGVTDGNADADGDGYTNLEEFLNGLAP